MAGLSKPKQLQLIISNYCKYAALWIAEDGNSKVKRSAKRAVKQADKIIDGFGSCDEKSVLATVRKFEHARKDIESLNPDKTTLAHMAVYVAERTREDLLKEPVAEWDNLTERLFTMVKYKDENWHVPQSSPQKRAVYLGDRFLQLMM